MVTVAGHTYPWDVLGDPDFPARAAGLGVGAVTLAAAYHSCRAATPLHPTRQVVDASYAALYRRVRPEVWSGRRLAPLAPGWLSEPDPFGDAARILATAGLPVNAWVVLTHNTRLGTAHPDVTVVNCFGERYPYALCPQWTEVREYAATLAAEACRDVPVEGVSLEACGQLGLTHLSHHEKTDGAWSPASVRLLSVCCCAACRAAWRARGLDDHRIVADLRAVVRALSASTDVDAPVAELIGAETASGVLEARHAAATALRGEVLAGLPAGIRVTLHASPDPWATGPSPGLAVAGSPAGTAPAAVPGAPGATSLPGVASVLVPAWPTGPGTAAGVAAMRSAVGPDVRVGAYMTVLAPVGLDEVAGHVGRLRAAGADELHLYHLGLAPAGRHDGFASAVKAFEG
ncbi:hypothetical protein Lfu02_65730 [Longispora fulva]|uniref:Alanine-rich protein n=1 Tax=Longispora fulva TaxID=619741 RepID=A0A8J7KGQ5_9ACTN|nr:hypothetical protein [Longispora fulva]MBG6137640.1 hypothetical protein [Longispora fulva]GIG62201.1 hypothetical protein Lfu02_65730 [Longispora fulva]